jgi:hypothetical protein
VGFTSPLFRVHQILLQSLLHDRIQLEVAFFSKQRRPLVQVLRYPHIEASLERGVRRLTLRLAEGKILIDRTLEVFSRLVTPAPPKLTISRMPRIRPWRSLSSAL